MAEKVGRPTLMTPETISKLEEAFSYGASDIEACFIAGIGKTTLYNYQEEHPEFVERKEGLKNMIKYRAKKNIAMRILDEDKDNLQISQWYAERKIKDEFSQKVESDITSNGEGLQPILVKFINAKPTEGN